MGIVFFLGGMYVLSSFSTVVLSVKEILSCLLRIFGWVSVILQEIVLKNGYTMELSRGFPFVQLFGKQHTVSKDCFCMWLSQTQRDFEIAKDP